MVGRWFDINEFTSRINVGTPSFSWLVINDPVLTVWVALNIAKIFPPSIRLRVLKAYDSFNYAGV